jgi:hypothetical protein
MNLPIESIPQFTDSPVPQYQFHDSPVPHYRGQWSSVAFGLPSSVIRHFRKACSPGRPSPYGLLSEYMLPFGSDLNDSSLAISMVSLAWKNLPIHTR